MLKELKEYIFSKSENIVYIKLRVIPKSNKTEIVSFLEDESWKIKVKAVPEKGKANKEIESFLLKNLNVEKVEICSGAKDRIKLIRIEKMFNKIRL